MTRIEIIERKGIGHPDTIADNFSENLGKRLKEEYLKVYKKELHYNVDKTLVCAGEIKQNKFISPVKIVFGGQYTKIKNINKILIEVTKETLKTEIKRGLKYKIYNFLNQGSLDLNNNFNLKKSNDTSFAVGHPETKNERLVKSLGFFLDNLHRRKDFIGTDNKIMFIFDGKKTEIYIALAFLKKTKNYFKEKERLEEEIFKKFKINVKINTADTIESQFLTKTGTSLEMGDSGATGRGNRRNGLITPQKPMTLEAYYGKNSLTHIGRIYQDKAISIAKKEKRNILLINKIGNNLNDFKILKW